MQRTEPGREQEVIIHEDSPEIFGGKRIVLARTSDRTKYLWWNSPYQSRTGREVSQFCLADRTGGSTVLTLLHRGGGIKSLDLPSYAKEIDAFFGVPVTLFLEIDQTIVVEKA